MADDGVIEEDFANPALLAASLANLDGHYANGAVTLNFGRESYMALRTELERLRWVRACAEDFLAYARRYRAGDPSLDPEEWYIESESLANALKEVGK